MSLNGIVTVPIGGLAPRRHGPSSSASTPRWSVTKASATVDDWGTPWTGRLADDLRDYYGRSRVYLDLDSNRAAQDYLVQIDEAMRSSRVVIAVIGPTWVDGRSVDGSRRIMDPNDLVRRELDGALSSGIALIPVLVGGAQPPSARDLPPSLGALCRMQALRLADDDWDYDFGRLVEAIERHGLIPSSGDEDAVPSDSQGKAGELQAKVVATRRYERSLQASRRRALDAVIGAVEALNYKERRIAADAARVTFKAAGRDVSVQVIDAVAGRSTVVVEYPTVKTGALVVGIVATAGYGAVAWPVLRAWERNFAKGFLDNVEGVLEGRGIVGDSVLPPGVSKWFKRNRSV